MAIEELQFIAQQMPEIETSIKKAEELIAFAKEVGEDTSGMVGELAQLKNKKRKYQVALRAHGLKVD